MNVFHMSTARLEVRPTGLDELTAGADDRRYQRLAGTALLGMREHAVLALVYLHAQSKLDAVGDVQPVEGLTAKLGQL